MSVDAIALPASFPVDSAKPDGARAVVSRPAEAVWMLRMENAPDNRLTPDFITKSLLPALDHIETEYYKACERGMKQGSMILAGEGTKGKFFSNGLQLELVGPGFWKDQYYHLVSRILTFPLSTVSAINGHCFAGGLCLALACDWRIVRPDRTWLSMNEILFGAPIPAGLHAILANRLSSPVVTKVLLTGHKYVAQEALRDGLVDEIAKEDGSEKCVERAIQVAKERSAFAETGVLVAMKQVLYAKTLAQLSIDEPSDLFQRSVQDREDRAKALIAASTQAKL
ncbi:hypothetical protein JCM10212_001565 [Sporobolomyces blumeae]